MARKKTHEEYVKEVFKINSNIEVIGKYINNKTKILHKCKIDGYEWYVIPKSILKGCGCPKCGGTLKLTHEEYIEKVAEINPNIKVLDTYVDIKTKILHKCLVDYYEWMVTPDSILHGIGCPKCNTSHGERNIESYLRMRNINYITQHRFADCRNKVPLPFDFYLPEYNVCIEYNGKQHYESVDYFGGEKTFNLIQQRDAIKKQYCKDNDIALVIVRYNENIEKVLDIFFKNRLEICVCATA